MKSERQAKYWARRLGDGWVVDTIPLLLVRGGTILPQTIDDDIIVATVLAAVNNDLQVAFHKAIYCVYTTEKLDLRMVDFDAFWLTDMNTGIRMKAGDSQVALQAKKLAKKRDFLWADIWPAIKHAYQ